MTLTNLIASVFLVTVHDPISSDSGDIAAALYGSFLPIPPVDAFAPIDTSEYTAEKVPGAIVIHAEKIVLNKGRERIKLRVTNTGDRPIQVSRIPSLCRCLYPSIRIGWLALPLYRNKPCVAVRSR